MKISTLITRGFTIWLLIICAEVFHGILRVLALEPLVGDFRARQIAVFTGAVIILTISILFIRWINATEFRELFLIGSLWLILTVSFEIILGRFLMNLSWERILSDYNILEGGLLPVGLIILFFSPMIAAKAKRLIGK